MDAHQDRKIHKERLPPNNRDQICNHKLKIEDQPDKESLFRSNLNRCNLNVMTADQAEEKRWTSNRNKFSLNAKKVDLLEEKLLTNNLNAKKAGQAEEKLFRNNNLNAKFSHNEKKADLQENGNIPLHLQGQKVLQHQAVPLVAVTAAAVVIAAAAEDHQDQWTKN